MNTKLAGLLCLCIFCCVPIFARDISKISSKNGVVILKSGEKYTGELYFFYKSDLIQIKLKDNQSKAFTAHQVAKFRFYDENFNTDRVFISIDSKTSGLESKIKPGFYELISWGEVEVIGKLKFEDNSAIDYYKNPRLASNKAYVPKLISYDYFVYYANQIQTLSEFKKEFFSTIIKEFSEVDQFIKDENLNLNDIYAQLKFIAFFNKHMMPINYDMKDFAE
ncbi:MAG: hypothetical protein CMO01_11585 [Thalassobius sp.]|nr:hypothetical protein [Thalassovita sp.]